MHLCARSSAGGCVTRTLSASTSQPISKWRAICAIAAANSSTASMRIRICTSRRRWTTSICRPATLLLRRPLTEHAARFLVLSFTSDWLYPTYQSLETVSALRGRNIDVAFCELNSTYGHDAFLLETQRANRNDQRVSGVSSATAAILTAKRNAPSIVDSVDQHAPRLRHDRGYRRTGLASARSRLRRRRTCSRVLQTQKNVDARGVEIDPNKVRRAIARGVSAYQSDIDHGFTDYPDKAFDFVILSQTLQETRYPLAVLREMLRVGRHAIVAFPNFGHWTTRLSHLTSGRAPRTRLFPARVA